MQQIIFLHTFLQTWKETFHNHSLTTDTKKISKPIDASLETINATIHDMLHKMNHCKNGFILDLYLKHGRRMTTPLEKIQSAYAQNQEKNIIAPDAVHIGLYDMLADMRKRIANEKDMPLYMVFNKDAIRNVCIHLPASKGGIVEGKRFRQSKR